LIRHQKRHVKDVDSTQNTVQHLKIEQKRDIGVKVD